jgi:transcriptional regulator with XRE-family HTH domain
MTERVAFGLELQRARERRGLSLDELAECTKISGTLFAGLERDDVSLWPSGIFRRAFVRSYAQAVGLDSEDTVRRFLRLYREGDDGAEAAPPALAAVPHPGDGGAPAAGPRLVLAQPEAAAPARLARLLRRSAAALVDVALALVAALLVSAWFGGAWFWMTGALAAALGHVLTCSLVGTTPGGWLLKLHARPSVKPRCESPVQVKPRVEAETPAASSGRRRQPRHASGPRPVAAPRPRRVQY